MALQQIIKIAIFLVIALVVFNLLKKQPFFKIEPGQVSSGSLPANSTPSMSATQIQNEQIKSQLHRLNSRAQTQYIAGCMKTPSGCKCYGANGKKVEVANKVCLQNVRDASGNQYKAFNSGHN